MLRFGVRDDQVVVEAVTELTRAGLGASKGRAGLDHPFVIRLATLTTDDERDAERIVATFDPDYVRLDT